MQDDIRELDAASLKALAHPVRVRIMQILGERERASVTGLAAELAESTSSVSYHLRQLAEQGLVRQDVDGPGPTASRRGRPQAFWRRTAAQLHVSAFDFLADDTTRAATQVWLHEYEQGRSRRLAHWFATVQQWPEEWQRASSDSDTTLQLSPARTRELADELAAVVARYRAAPADVGRDDDVRPVAVQYAVFPAAAGADR